MMKKLLLIALVFIGFQYAQAQEKPMSVELQAGLPIGDADDFSDFAIGANFTYLFAEVTYDFHIGARAGYNMFIADSDLDIDNMDFITLAAVGRYNITDQLFGRLDAGYAIGMQDDSDGGVLIEPRFGYFNYDFDVFAYYQTILEDDFNFDSIGVGFAYKF